MSPFYKGDVGFIVIPRQSRAHWVWENPIFYRWWSQMIMSALWEDAECRVWNKNVLLRRGQFAISIRDLAKKFGYKDMKNIRKEPNFKTVAKFLKDLEDSNLVVLSKVGEEGSGTSSGTSDGTRSGTNCGTRYGTRSTTVVTIVNYDDYQLISKNGRESSGTRSGTRSGTKDGPTGGTSDGTSNGTDTYYNKNINKLNNKLTHTTRAREESEASQRTERDKWKAELAADGWFWENTAMALHRPLAEIKAKLSDYHCEAQAVMQSQASYSDYKRDLFNWLRRDGKYAKPSAQDKEAERKAKWEAQERAVRQGLREDLAAERKIMENGISF